MKNIYQDQTYLEANPTWHEEDSPWKAAQVARMIAKHKLAFRTVAEIGCGGGGILTNLQGQLPANVEFEGFDVAPAAIAMARTHERDRLHFYEEDLLKSEKTFDLLLVIDVVEHVPDYLGFLEKCRTKSRYQIYHFPLDLHVSSVLRATFVSRTASVGHLHYFTAQSATSSLKASGHKIIDAFYTNSALGLGQLHPSLKTKLANIPRRMVSLVSTEMAARLLGGYSLLLLTENGSPGV